MEALSEFFPQIVLHVFAPLLCVSLAAWAALCLCRFLSRCFCTLGRRVPPAQWGAIAAVMVVCTLFSGKNTNSVQSAGVGAMGIPPVAMLMHGSSVSSGGMPVAPAVTPEDMSNGWRVVEVADAGEFAPPPANAVTNERWLLRGAHDDAFRIPTNGWSYPFVLGVTVLSCGEIRKNITSRDFPRAFEQDLSLLPVANWQFLPDGRNESVFWYGATPSNTLIATWWNAALGRDATNPVCFQAELHTNGGFDYRYEDRTVRHVRVWPFDLDDDGLENTVDPDPLIAGSDAHGTNAEWYNTVCSNVFEAVENGGTGGTGGPPVQGGGGHGVPALPWREGVNSNAYYFVDVVAADGPAPIYFTGDRESRLGNPVVVAIGGETNHVPLLIGVNYSVTSTVPISVIVPTDGYAEHSYSGDRSCAVHWPLEFQMMPSGVGYLIDATPYDPGGTFTWSSVGAGGGGLCLMGIQSCSFATNGNWIGFTACGGGNCGCGGCQVGGCYLLEGTSFELPYLWCGCTNHGGDGGGEGGGSTNEPPPSVSVSFSNSAVFYEDAYTNAPGVVVARNSSGTTLSVSAAADEYGGILYVTAENVNGKLRRVGGDLVSFPYTAFVPPDGEVSFSVECEAEAHSGSQNDVSVSATISPGGGGTPFTATGFVTVAEILIEAESDFPTNKHRHVLGPAEGVKYSINPPGVGFTLQGNVPFRGMHDYLQGRIVMPFCASQFTMEAVNGSTSLSLPFTVIEPEANPSIDSVVLPSEEDWARVMNAAPLHEGDIGSVFHVNMSLKPSYVSFGALGIMELYAAATDVQGFFTNAVFNGHIDHNTNAGAFRDISVNDDNSVGTGDNVFFALDNAFLPYLQYGTFKLEIPVVWYVRNDSVTNSLAVFEARNTVYHNADVTVSKYSISVTRGTNDVYTISR